MFYTDEDFVEVILQLKLDKRGASLLGTSAKGFLVWLLENDTVVYLKLPHGTRNIISRMMCSNSCMLSQNNEFLVAGIR